MCIQILYNFMWNIDRMWHVDTKHKSQTFRRDKLFKKQSSDHMVKHTLIANI